MTHTPGHTTSKRSTYVGVFDDRNSADKAARELRTAGFKDDEIGYAWRDDSGKTQKEGETKAGEMAAEGAVTGAALGGLIGAAAAGLIPGIGPIIAGGISGAFVGMGIPEEEAKYYNDEFKQGRTLMTVKSTDKYDLAGDTIRRGGGWDWDTRNERKTTNVNVDNKKTV